ncbi:ANTAR domain-containing protein [Streptomyces sp. NPDC015414]|uniref:ANTAR domain-containing protein n=1 Tax=Streptomyces sp. NPDC015414 TaxID=3364957 RepID=UPI0037013A5A
MHPSRPEARFVRLSAAADPVSTALERSEHARLRRTLTARATIHMAEGALAALGPLPIEDATRALVDVARALNLNVHVVAEQVHRVLVQYRRGARH